MTPEVAPTKRQLKTLTNSVITSMQQQEHQDQLKTILEDLQYQILALQKPQLMYKPPHSDEYIKITEYLDNVEERLLKLEKDSHKAPRTNHGERLTKLEEKINGISSTDL